MKVADAPITLLTDCAQCEVTILMVGVRIVMTSEEASSLWAELDGSLRKIYADHPERCPPKFSDLLSRERIADREPSIRDRPVPLERVLEGIIAYAQRSSVSPDGLADPSADTRPPVGGSDVEMPKPSSGVFGRAIGRLTGR